METDQKILDSYLDDISRLKKERDRANGFADQVFEIPIEDITPACLEELEDQIKKAQTCNSVISYIGKKIAREMSLQS